MKERGLKASERTIPLLCPVERNVDSTSKGEEGGGEKKKFCQFKGKEAPNKGKGGTYRIEKKGTVTQDKEKRGYWRGITGGEGTNRGEVTARKLRG